MPVHQLVGLTMQLVAFVDDQLMVTVEPEVTLEGSAVILAVGLRGDGAGHLLITSHPVGTSQGVGKFLHSPVTGFFAGAITWKHRVGDTLKLN